MDGNGGYEDVVEGGPFVGLLLGELAHHAVPGGGVAELGDLVEHLAHEAGVELEAVLGVGVERLGGDEGGALEQGEPEREDVRLLRGRRRVADVLAQERQQLRRQVRLLLVEVRPLEPRLVPEHCPRLHQLQHPQLADHHVLRPKVAQILVPLRQELRRANDRLQHEPQLRLGVELLLLQT